MRYQRRRETVEAARFRAADLGRGTAAGPLRHVWRNEGAAGGHCISLAGGGVELVHDGEWVVERGTGGRVEVSVMRDREFLAAYEPVAEGAE